jgi:CubicO group peptidase (beta-lactamase class C family)
MTYDFYEDSPVSELYRQARLMSDAERSLEALVGELSRLPLAYQPGTKWHYSLAIDVIGHLIEIISGQPLAEFLHERLFVPLGMVDTGFFVPPEKRQRVATMYGLPDICSNTMRQISEAWMRGFNQRIHVEATYPSTNTHSFARGGHGLFATIGDYARFVQMLLNGGELDGERILAPSIVEFMHLNHVSSELLPFAINGVTRTGYGFGLGSQVLLNVAESALPGSVGEVSGGGATRTHFWIDARKELIGVLMTQYMAGYDLPEKDLHILAHQAMLN